MSDHEDDRNVIAINLGDAEVEGAHNVHNLYPSLLEKFYSDDVLKKERVTVELSANDLVVLSAAITRTLQATHNLMKKSLGVAHKGTADEMQMLCTHVVSLHLKEVIDEQLLSHFGDFITSTRHTMD